MDLNQTEVKNKFQSLRGWDLLCLGLPLSQPCSGNPGRGSCATVPTGPGPLGKPLGKKAGNIRPISQRGKRRPREGTSLICHRCQVADLPGQRQWYRQVPRDRAGPGGTKFPCIGWTCRSCPSLWRESCFSPRRSVEVMQAGGEGMQT